MAKNDPGKNQDGDRLPPRDAAKSLMRTGRKAALATLDSKTGHPYASLVTVATEPCGTPIILISNLALHTRNAKADPRASLLFDGTGVDGDPLAGGRLTVLGILRASDSETAPARFLARHPDAAVYAGFADFAFYTLEIERAHYVGGFGRIVAFKPSDLLVPLENAAELILAGSEIISHMNEDHPDAIELYARVLLRADEKGGPWRMTGIDPEGADLVGAGDALRLNFEQRVTDANSARSEFARLARAAREHGSHK